MVTLLFIAATGVESSVKNIAKASNHLGDDIYKTLAKEEGNIVFSPFSLFSSLSLLTLGAGGNTQRQLLSKLSQTNTQTLKENFEAMLKHIVNASRHTLQIANSLFIANQFPLLESFVTAAERVFKAKAQKVDYTKRRETATLINKWVAKQTNKSITSVVDENSFDGQTTLMLLNAIYFKGKWKVAFNKADTINNYVFNTPTKKVTCRMMTMKPSRLNFVYSKSGFTILSLPFHATNINIAFVKPILNKSLADVELTLNTNNFFEAVENFRRSLVEVKIPRFHIAAEYPLKQQLMSAGIDNIFNKANFSNLYTVPVPTSVSEVNQKALIEITEVGVTASAVTIVRKVVRSKPIIQKFTLDSPFLFFLYDSHSELIFLRGRIENPIAPGP